MNGQSLDQQQESTIYVRNLDERVTEELLKELFTQVGTVVGVTIRGSQPNATEKKAPSNRFAFIEFADVDSVLFACEIMDAVEIYGQKLKVQPRDNTLQKGIYLQLKMNDKSYERHRGGGGGIINNTNKPINRRSDMAEQTSSSSAHLAGTYGDRPVATERRGGNQQQQGQRQIFAQSGAFNNANMRRFNSMPWGLQQQQQQPQQQPQPWKFPPGQVSFTPPAAPNWYQPRVDSVVQQVQEDGGRYRAHPTRQQNNYSNFDSQHHHQNQRASSSYSRENRHQPYKEPYSQNRRLGRGRNY